MIRMVRSLPNSTFTWKSLGEIIIGKHSYMVLTGCASHCVNLLQKRPHEVGRPPKLLQNKRDDQTCSCSKGSKKKRIQ